MTTRIGISSSQGSYDVVIERGSLANSDTHFAPATNARRALIVADEAVASTHAAAVYASLAGNGWTLATHTLSRPGAPETNRGRRVRVACCSRAWP